MVARPDKQRVFGTEEATATGILGMLGSDKEIKKRLSDLTDEEIGYLALLDTIGTKMKLGVIKSFIENFCEYRVSRFRLGRRELAGVLTFAGFGGEERRKAKSIRDLFSGIR